MDDARPAPQKLINMWTLFTRSFNCRLRGEYGTTGIPTRFLANILQTPGDSARGSMASPRIINGKGKFDICHLPFTGYMNNGQLRKPVRPLKLNLDSKVKLLPAGIRNPDLSIQKTNALPLYNKHFS